ncbi:Collagen binding domain protein [Fructobacillus sp. EFB-N1]|uniref:collagen binding domain-containing protein n=1 Tax=Fructobacillus sp. EFB-N1 TaxID=1658766 RepID=UPI00064D7793|nr:collagen binding domain-containing protein [Fructobacillus sp. EFB-N1]KMK52997.1 Collagen binding domain protein [Fructobacillus sp. EFB-N1]
MKTNDFKNRPLLVFFASFFLMLGIGAGTVMSKVSAGDVSSAYITSASVYKTSNHQTDNFNPYDDLTVRWNFAIPKGAGIAVAQPIAVVVPDVFQVPNSLDFQIHEQNGDVIANAHLDKNTREITVHFTSDSAATDVNRALSGYFEINSNWDLSKISFNTKNMINWQLDHSIIPGASTDVYINQGNAPDKTEVLSKFGWFDLKDPTLLHWKVRINYRKQNIQNAVVVDQLDGNSTFVPDSFGSTIDSSDGEAVPVDLSKLTIDSDSKFHIDFGDINQTYVLTYESRVKSGSQVSSYGNAVNLTGDNLSTQSKTMMVEKIDGGGNASVGPSATPSTPSKPSTPNTTPGTETVAPTPVVNMAQPVATAQPSESKANTTVPAFAPAEIAAQPVAEVALPKAARFESSRWQVLILTAISVLLAGFTLILKNKKRS